MSFLLNSNVKNYATVKYLHVMSFFIHATAHYLKYKEPKIEDCLVLSFRKQSSASLYDQSEALYHKIIGQYRFYEYSRYNPVGALAFPDSSNPLLIWEDTGKPMDPDQINLIFFARNPKETQKIIKQVAFRRKYIPDIQLQSLGEFGNTIPNALSHFMTPYESDNYNILGNYKPMIFPLSSVNGHQIDKKEAKKTAQRKLRNLEDEIFDNSHSAPIFI